MPTKDLDVTDPVDAPVIPDSNTRWKVKLTDPEHLNKVVFSSVSEMRARAFVEKRFPRGSEAHLVSPDGVIESYEQERVGPRGTDASRWASFDPSTWVRPVSVHAGENLADEWADRES